MSRLLSLTMALSLAVLCIVPAGRTESEKRPTPIDLATLLPDSTLAYLELKHPPLMQEFRELMKGSALEDYAAFRDEHGPKERDRFGRYFGSGTILAFIFTPEFLDELARFNQHAIALTGFDKHNSPRGVWIMDAGDSNIANLIVRDVLTLMPEFRTVAKVEGVRLYRYHWRFEELEDKAKENNEKGKDEKAQQPPPPSPVIAIMPKRIVIGSDVEVVSDVVSRWQGKKNGRTLAESKEFASSTDLRDKPGMFGYARLDKVFGKDGPLVRGGKAPWAFDSFFGAETVFLRTAAFFNPQSVERATAYLGVDKGSLELQMRFATPADGTSPLGTLMGDKPASHTLLHYAPKHSLAALSMPLAGKATAWTDALKQLEPIAKRYNINDLTKMRIEEALVEKKIDPGNDIFAHVANAGLAVIPVEKGAPDPVVMIEAISDDAGVKLQETWKTLKQILPQEEVKTLELRRKGKMLVLAASGETAELALASGAKSDGFAAKPEVATMLKGATKAKLVGGWSVQNMIGLWLAAEQKYVAELNERVKKRKIDEKDVAVLRAYEKWLKKTAGELPTQLGKLPAGELSVTAGKDHVTFRLRQSELRGPLARLVDTFLLLDMNRPDDYRFREEDNKKQ